MHPIPRQILPLRPRGRGWIRVPMGRATDDRLAQAGLSRDKTSLWAGFYHRGQRLMCISEISMRVELPGADGEFGPTWLISTVRRAGQIRRRCTTRQLDFVRAAFGAQEAEEDNHQPGMTRCLFLPVDPAYRNVCECKTNEVQITESGGYVWSQSAERCRGCDLSMRLGLADVDRRCPLHPDQSWLPTTPAGHVAQTVRAQLTPVP